MPLIVLLNIAVTGVHLVSRFILHGDIAGSLNSNIKRTFGFFRHASAVIDAAGTLLRHKTRIKTTAFYFVVARHRHIRAKTIGVNVGEVIGANLLLEQRLGGSAECGINQPIHFLALHRLEESLIQLRTGRNHLSVRLVITLGGHEIDQFVGNIHIGAFEHAGGERAARAGARRTN